MIKPKGVPAVIKFVAAGRDEMFAPHFEWRLVGYRTPRKGEYYLSGCDGHVCAWQAPNDLSSVYFVVTKGREMRAKMVRVFEPVS